MTLRKLANDGKTIDKMLLSESVITQPAYHYFGEEEMMVELT